MRRLRAPHGASIHRMTVASRTFLLESGREAARLRQECIRAARRGGGLVSIVSADGRRIEALITPGLDVFFDAVPVGPQIDDDDEPASFEWEYTWVQLVAASAPMAATQAVGG